MDSSKPKLLAAGPALPSKTKLEDTDGNECHQLSAAAGCTPVPSPSLSSMDDWQLFTRRVLTRLMGIPRVYVGDLRMEGTEVKGTVYVRSDIVEAVLVDNTAISASPGVGSSTNPAASPCNVAMSDTTTPTSAKLTLSSTDDCGKLPKTTPTL